MGDSALVHLLLEAGAEIEYKNARTWTSLSFLWDPDREPHSSQEMGKILELCSRNYFEAWSDPDVMGWTPAHRAAAYGTGDDIRNLHIRSLHCKGASMHSYNKDLHWTPITYSIWRNNESTFAAFVRILTTAEIVQFRDNRGWTLLHFAAEQGSERMLKTLLELGVDREVLSIPTKIWIMDELEGQSLIAENIAYACGHGDIWDKVVQEVDAG
jgi:ankyrin repeat protein